MKKGQSQIFKRLLKSTGRTQRELAKEIGISESILSRVLSGKRRLGVDTALVVSRMSGIPLEEFFR